MNVSLCVSFLVVKASLWTHTYTHTFSSMHLFFWVNVFLPASARSHPVGSLLQKRALSDLVRSCRPGTGAWGGQGAQFCPHRASNTPFSCRNEREKEREREGERETERERESRLRGPGQSQGAGCVCCLPSPWRVPHGHPATTTTHCPPQEGGCKMSMCARSQSGGGSAAFQEHSNCSKGLPVRWDASAQGC